MTKPSSRKSERSDLRTRFKTGHRGLRREKNPSWKGDKASYYSIHMWLKANFGKPTKCENKDGCFYPRKNKNSEVTLRPKRFEYALIHGKKYSHNRDNFMTLCTSCHAKYDKRGLPIKKQRGLTR